MENTKTYVAKIYWILLTAIVYAVLAVFFKPWLHKQFESSSLIIPIISIAVFTSIFYLSLGIITSRWKEAAIAFSLSVCIELLYNLLPQGFNSFKPTLFFFLHPFSVLLFIYLLAGLKNKLFAAYFVIMGISAIYMISYFAAVWIGNLAQFIDDSDTRSLFKNFLTIFVYTGSYIFQFIFYCELINYVRGSQYPEKTTSLNLGNDYPKAGGIITFWTVKLMILVIVSGTPDFILNYIRYFLNDAVGKSDAGTYFRLTAIVSMLSILCMTLFIGWYLRKFLLENFITFNIRSKFMYWFSLIPFIGLIAFLVLQADSKKQERYREKIDTLRAFASSSASGVTILFIIILGLRLLWALAQGDIVIVLSLIISGILFAWLVVDKNGYKANLGIVAVSVAAAFIITFFVSRRQTDTMVVIVSTLLMNLIYLILIFPVYHIEEFEYIPGQNPDPEQGEKTDLF